MVRMDMSVCNIHQQPGHKLLGGTSRGPVTPGKCTGNQDRARETGLGVSGQKREYRDKRERMPMFLDTSVQWNEASIWSNSGAADS